MKVVVVDKPSATQVQVRLASRGIARSSADFHAAEVCATAFGGLFTSRLMQALRVDEGLTYGASCWLASHAAGGAVYIQSSTRTDAVNRLVSRALAECERARDPGIGSDEIVRARTYMTASFPFDIETSPQVAQALGEIALFGLPDDYIETYPSQVSSIGPETTTAFAKAHLPHQDVAIVAVGEAKLLAKALSSFGPVKVVRLSEIA
jgi:zinc protease